ncbi:MAG: mechanosensitive ion channel family protein [Oligoflexia bacterium]|nr:mechanosensitive ion channel family protein [Oligoflexia bacterium]
MSTKSQQPWIPLDRIEDAARVDAALVILSLALGAWFFYKIFLGRLSEERHRNLKSLFWNLGGHTLAATVLLISYWYLDFHAEPETGVDYIAGYIGLAGMFSAAVVFMKTARILLFEYLFLGHMKQGVPLLLVNFLSLILSILIVGWFATEIFAFKVTSLLATSAMFSVVIGLALQDTLGNLFAGAALQMDKPYEIGDWVEIGHDSIKWVGQVYEVSWRATILIGFADELITIPNRVVAQSQISNFAAKRNPIIRGHIFRIPYKTNLEEVRKLLLEAALKVTGVRAHPAPMVLLQEAHDSWMQCKLVYFIDNYGAQYLIGDQVLTESMKTLDAAGIQLAHPRLIVEQDLKGNRTQHL